MHQLEKMLLHESLYESFKERLLAAYNTVKIGDPLDGSNLMGPLSTKAAVKEFTDGIETIKSQGGSVVRGGKVIEGPGFFVEPTIIKINHNAPIIK